MAQFVIIKMITRSDEIVPHAREWENVKPWMMWNFLLQACWA
jgi:hypothetical protein